MLVTAVRGSWFRCYERLEVGFAPGLVGIVGPNGAGKTSLVEMIHFGALAYSPRTATEAQVIAFGHDFTRVEVDAELAAGPARVQVGFRPGEPKRVVVDGVAERSAAGLLGRFPVLVFTPDRIRLVQAGPALRRTYLDRALVRLWPALAEIPAAYARALAQRNHLLRRLRAGRGAEEALVGWDDVTARAGAELSAARERLCTLLAPAFGARLEQLGGDPGDAPLRLVANADATALADVLRERHRRDIERAAHGGRAAPGRRRAARGGPRPAPVRITGRAAAGAPGADPGRGRPARPPSAASSRCCSSTTSPASSTPSGAGCCSRPWGASSRRS